MAKVGTKGKYHKWLEEDSLILLKAWARDGLIDEQIARNIGITNSTLYEWKLKYSEFSEALKKGKEVVDIEVENALMKRAIGYYYEEDVSTKDGICRLEKYAHGDVGAQIFWLKNRKRKDWKDKQDLDNHISKDTIKEILKNLSPEELDEVLKDV